MGQPDHPSKNGAAQREMSNDFLAKCFGATVWYPQRFVRSCNSRFSFEGDYEIQRFGSYFSPDLSKFCLFGLGTAAGSGSGAAAESAIFRGYSGNQELSAGTG